MVNKEAAVVKDVLVIKPYMIAKFCIYVFFTYMLLYIYLFGEKLIILYGSVFVATMCVLYGIIRSNESVLSVCPSSVLLNLLMCAYSLVTGIFVALDQQALLSVVKAYASFSIVCFDICYISKKEKSMDWLMNFYLYISLFISFYVLVNGTFLSGYGYVISNRQNPNILGLTMDLGLFSIAYKSIKTKERRAFYLCVAILFLYIIIGCGSRKCLIGALIICVLWLVTFAKQMWNKGSNSRIILVALIGIITVTVWYYYQNVYINTYSYNRMEILGSSEKGTSSQIRKMYYQYAVSYFSEYPIFGIGLGQFAAWNPLNGYSHSTYAEALADWGFVGCVIFFVPAIIVGIKILRSLYFKTDVEMGRVFLALWIMEVFMGVGQIWFYEIQHLVAWTIIYLYYDMQAIGQQTGEERKCKYVKV